MKPALSRGEIQCIGATTQDEYRKYIERDAALERRFQAVLIEEPGPIESIEILEGVKARYEEFHWRHLHATRGQGGRRSGAALRLRPLPPR